jgi:ferredoxin
MTWHLEVDADVCIASGMCAGLAPDLFTLGEEHSSPVEPNVEPNELALDAADSCPTLAIRVTDQGVEIGPRP